MTTMLTTPPPIVPPAGTIPARPTNRSPSDPTPDAARPHTPEDELPEGLRNLARGVAHAYRVEVTPVAASLLAILASALGPKASCLVAGRRMPIGFNCLTVTPADAPIQLGWLHLLTSPLHAYQSRREDYRLRVGDTRLNQLRRDVRQDVEMLRASGRDPAELTRMTDHQRDLDFGALPRFIETGFSCERWRWSLFHCADGGVMVVESRQGMLTALEDAIPSDRLRLARWLREGWEGTSLLIDRTKSATGCITLVRSLPISDLTHPVMGGFLGTDDPLPILLTAQERSGRQLPASDPGVDLTDLHDRLAGLLSGAVRLRWRDTWTLAPLLSEAFEDLEQFRLRLGHRVLQSAGPPLNRRWLDWLPDLAVRIANVVAIFRQELATIQTPRVTRDDLGAAIRWMEAGLIEPHCRLLGRVVSPASVERVRSRLQLTDTEQRIYHRIQERAGLTPRELSRSLHRIDAETRDHALTELFRRGLVESNRDGRLYGVRRDDETPPLAMSSFADTPLVHDTNHPPIDPIPPDLSPSGLTRLTRRED